jgi:hypothetical protein
VMWQGKSILTLTLHTATCASTSLPPAHFPHRTGAEPSAPRRTRTRCAGGIANRDILEIFHAW